MVRLKRFRVEAGLTQSKLASAVGVSQPNYQRWESGAAQIPEDKLKKLSQILKASTDELMGTHKPIEAGFYDPNAGDEISYYGEVAVHFCGGGQSLLLSISEKSFSQLHRDLQGDHAFVIVESLANQTVALRTKAIADLYFSSEAHDDYGPEHGAYEDHVGLLLPDPRDWEIIECFACDEAGIEDFSAPDLQRIREAIMITDEQYDQLVADGRIKAEHLHAEREKNQISTDRILSNARDTTYQLSNGCRRKIFAHDRGDLFNAFDELLDFNGGISEDDMIRWEVEGSHRIIFINKGFLDYVMIPTHQLKEGKIEVASAELDK